MGHFCKTILSVVLIVTIAVQINGQVTPAVLIFTQPGNNLGPYSLKLEEADVPSNEQGFIDFLTLIPDVSIVVCGIGIWRFYPDADFQGSPGNIGYQIGGNLQPQCYDLDTLGPAFAAMKSYRSLGGENLNQQAIHVFEEEFGIGRSFSILAPIDFTNGPILNIPTSFGPVGSFLITGQADANPSVPDYALAPVFKIFDDETANPSLPSVCFSLATPDESGVLNKFHFQGRMTYNDSGVPTLITMGALDYASYDSISSNPVEFCPKIVEVRVIKEELMAPRMIKSIRLM
ncbi:uncharacterized protein LOC110863202 [Folsomia candida]|nr:uncharacterized protein LOC110863202 [Folsomia candida]